MFQRESKENLLNRMVSFSRAVSPKLTDFRRGSVIRTIYEAVALVLEGAYNKIYTSLKGLIEENLYSTVGFDKEQAQPSSGIVYFGRVNPAEKAYVIPRGTEVVAKANDYRPPVTFRTTQEAIMDVGYTEVSVPVVCTEAGAITNIVAGDINDFVTRPTGIDSVTNRDDFTDGRDDETPEEQKNRFGDFMEANTRGTLQAIEYGAKKASITDSSTGLVTERVLQAVATEDPATKRGIVDLYIWNGVGSPSEALKAEVQKVLLGYYDGNGDRVYGYKNGGTLVDIYPTPTSSVTIRLTLTLETWASEAYVKNRIQKELESFFGSLRPGQTLFHNKVLERVGVEGVAGVKAELSTDDGATYNMADIAVDEKTMHVLAGTVYA